MRHLSQARHVGKLALTMPARFPAHGTTVIVGGTGTLGAILARHLVTRHGASSLALISRQGQDTPGAAELAAELESLGATVRLPSCDAADPAALAAVLDAIPDVRALVHCAGVLDDATAQTMSPGQLERVLRAKADVAWALHSWSTGRRLDAFVLYSSMAATVGTPGQAGYAAANAFAEELARLRSEAGLRSQALAWGLWDGPTGMTGHLDQADVGRLDRLGLAVTTSATGMTLLEEALATAMPVAYPIVAARCPPVPGTAVPGVLSELVRPGARGPLRQARNAATADIGAMAPEERDRHLRSVIHAELTAALGAPSPAQADDSVPFRDLGVDSLIAVEFRNRLSAALGLRLPSTLVFDHPTPAAVSGYVAGLVAPAGAAATDVTRDLDHITAVLAGRDLGQRDRQQILAALDGIAARFRDPDGPHPDGQHPDGGADLVQASDDQLFELLDRELGASGD